jgi:repressor LexA
MALVDAGYLAPLNGLQRGVRLTQPDQEASRALPLLGRIAAGQPIEAVAGDEFVTVPDALCGRGEHFVLRVRGDSMIEAGICDGDLAVIERAEDAHDGAIVAALIDEAETTLKRLQRRGELLYLCPANAAMQTLEYAAERVRVMGVLRGLMRRYR